MTGKISSGHGIDIVEVTGKAILHKKAYFVYVLDRRLRNYCKFQNT